MFSYFYVNYLLTAKQKFITIFGLLEPMRLLNQHNGDLFSCRISNKTLDATEKTVKHLHILKWDTGPLEYETVTDDV